MSEYQYYEFLAVDRALSQKEIAEIRKHSSRAEISATRFENEYNWGNFRGSVEEFLRRYYDLHLHYANWGTHRFGMGIPAKAVDGEQWKAYFPEGGIGDLKRNGDRLVVVFESGDESGDWDGEEVTMAELAPIREEVLSGDLRPLYLGWLAGISDPYADIEDDALEPPVPAGLKSLTPAQKAFATFLRVDEEILGVAAEASAAMSAESVDWRERIRELPAAEKDELLAAVLEGRAMEVASSLRRRLRPAGAANVGKGTRTAGAIRGEAESIREEKEKREAEEKARRRAEAERRAAIARAKQLDEMALIRGSYWSKVDALIATKVPKNYDEGVRILCDLRDVAKRHDHLAEFEERMEAVRTVHRAKSTFQERLRKAGLGSPERGSV
ncbi:MAG: hypothetical protein ACTHN5_07605 [Phycisphaerae bacterium]